MNGNAFSPMKRPWRVVVGIAARPFASIAAAVASSIPFLTILSSKTAFTTQVQAYYVCAIKETTYRNALAKSDGGKDVTMVS
ncbi:hypothetical protein E4U40_003885 [Claviceps sp. LM458 group G5]|nr:hypothetical protein E4U40_003885 [Claviceps sp. LM458 group G5]